MRVKRKLFLTTAFAALLSVGVFAGVASQKEASKVEAAGSTQSLNAYNVVFADESSIGFNTMHIWNISYDSDYYDHTDLEYWFDNYKGPITTGDSHNNNTTATYNSGDGSLDITQSTTATGWYSKGGVQYVFTFPHYVSGFNVIFKRANTWDRQSPTYTLSSKQRVLYGCYNSGYNHYGPESSSTTWTESFTYYNVTRKYGSTTLGTDKAYAYSYFDVPEGYAPSGYSFKGWYKDSSFTQPYSSAAVLSNTMTLFAKCELTVYTAYINGVSAGNLSATETAGEYKVTVNVSHGDVITFTKDSAAYAVTKEASANNNYDSNGVIFSGTGVDLYLKTGSSQFWLAGMPNTTSSHYLVINGDLGSILTLNPDDHGEKYAANVRFEANDMISFIYVDAPNTYSLYSLDIKDAVDHNLFTYTAGKIKCLVTGYYNIFIGISGSGDKAYIESVTGGAAYTFAQDFNNKIGTICNKAGTAGFLDELEDEWSDQSDTFGSLHVIAKNTLKEATPNPDSASEIEKFAAKYLRIIYLHGTTRFPNFVGRSDTSVASSGRFALISSITSSSGGTIAIIAVSGAVVAAVAGYFFFRKKKEN